MDEYSFISENGNVRQIRDLIAKEKDAEQDQRITELENKTIQDVYSTNVTLTNKVWINNEPIYRVVKTGRAGVNNGSWTVINFFNDNRNKSLTSFGGVWDIVGLRLRDISITNDISVSTVTGSGNGSSGTINYRIVLEFVYTD